MSEQRIVAGVDWGSSSFRAYHFDHGKIIDSITAPKGIKFIDQSADKKTDRFEQVLFDLIGDWLEPGDGVLLSGMITSVNGWVETPYLECPVSCHEVATRLTCKSVRGIDLHFLPGVCQRVPHADVMRGEELQLLGAGSNHTTNLKVMPGTHSKWAFTDSDTLLHFQTVMTGELFDALYNHTLLGQFSSGEQWHNASFVSGVERGYKSNALVTELFTTRSGVLLNEIEAEYSHCYLSGLLIGSEIREGLAMLPTIESVSVTLLGTDTLCDRYTTAFEHLAIEVSQFTATQPSLDNSSTINDAAAAGFSMLINNFNNTVTT